MAATFCNEGLNRMANIVIGNMAWEDWWVDLFTDIGGVGVTDTYASHTPCALSGYSDVMLAPANWLETPGTADDVFVYPTLTTLFDPYMGGTTIYGWRVYLYDGLDRRVYFEDLLATPFLVPSAGGALSLDLTYHFKQC